MPNKTKQKVKKKDEYSLALFLAIKNTFHKKTMLLLILMIISLGYLSTTFSSSVIHGLQYTIEQKAIDTVTGNVFITPKDDNPYLTNTNSIIKKVETIPGVKATSSTLKKAVTFVDKNGAVVPVQIKIVDPEELALSTIIDNNMIAGSYLSSHSTSGEIIVGADITKKYRKQEGLAAVDVDAGEKINAILDDGRTISLKVKGVYGNDFALSDMYVYMSKSDAQALYNLPDEYMDYSSNIMVKTQSRDAEFSVIRIMKEIGVNAEIWRWKDKLGILDDFVNSLMIISNLTAIIGVIIAFATIYIMIFINVLQKRSQIGILKAIGITKKTILLSYIFQSGIYGFLGATVGVGITYVLNAYLNVNPIIMPMGDVYPVISALEYVQSFAFLLVSSFFAGYFASKGVIKEKILDAIYKG